MSTHPSDQRAASSHARGFTLIELVVVIVILGFLAATALPKFIDIRDDAAKSSTLAMESAVRTAAALVHTKCLVTPACAAAVGGSYNNFTFNGSVYLMQYGYPDAGETINDREIDTAVNYTGFTVSLVAPRTRFTHEAAKTPASCYVEYKEPDGPGLEPTVTSVTSGC